MTSRRSSRLPIRCRPSSTCCGLHCCPDWSIRSRTTGGTGDATSGCSKLDRDSRARRARAAACVRVDRAAVTEHWSGRSRTVDFFDAKGVVELLCSALGVVPAFDRPGWPGSCRPERPAIDDRRRRLSAWSARCRQRWPNVPERLGRTRLSWPNSISTASIGCARVRVESVKPLPRHPFVVRDLSIVVADALPAEIIRGTIQTAGDGQAAPLVAVSFSIVTRARACPRVLSASPSG